MSRQDGLYWIADEDGSNIDIARWDNNEGWQSPPEGAWRVIGWECPVRDGGIKVLAGPLEYQEADK